MKKVSVMIPCYNEEENVVAIVSARLPCHKNLC